MFGLLVPYGVGLVFVGAVPDSSSPPPNVQLPMSLDSSGSEEDGILSAIVYGVKHVLFGVSLFGSQQNRQFMQSLSYYSSAFIVSVTLVARLPVSSRVAIPSLGALSQSPAPARLCQRALLRAREAGARGPLFGLMVG
jgi:hypothetical protein